VPERTPPARTTTQPEVHAVPRTFKPLPEGASEEQRHHAYLEMAGAYATIAAAYTSQLPRLIRDNEEFRVVQEAHGIRIGRLELWREDMQAAPPLPPMRAEFPSTADLVEHASKQLDAKVAAEIRDKSTPPPTPEKVASISKDVMAAAIAQVKQEEAAKKWEALEQERKAAETDRVAMEEKARQLKLQAEDDNRKLALENTQAKTRTKWAAILAGLLGIGTVVRELIEWAVRTHH
jgi:hypothetical protein